MNGLPNSANVDAWIVIFPFSAQDPVIGTSTYMSGLGLYRRPLISQAIVAAYALYEIDVIDAHTGKMIDYAHGNLGGSGLFPKWPVKGLDKSNWAATAAQMTDSQKDTLRDTLTNLVATSLPYALSRTHLLDALPPSSPAPSNVTPHQQQ